MARNLKINIKNTQLAQAVNLGGLRGKAITSREESVGVSPEHKGGEPEQQPASSEAMIREVKEEAPKIKARSRSAFAEQQLPVEEAKEKPQAMAETPISAAEKETVTAEEVIRPKSTAELRRQIFGDDARVTGEKVHVEPLPQPMSKAPVIHPERERAGAGAISEATTQPEAVSAPVVPPSVPTPPAPPPVARVMQAPVAMPPRETALRPPERRPLVPRGGERSWEGGRRERDNRDSRDRDRPRPPPLPMQPLKKFAPAQARSSAPFVHPPRPGIEKLGPTGKHIKDLLPPPRPRPVVAPVAAVRRGPERPAVPAGQKSPPPPREGDKDIRRRPLKAATGETTTEIKSPAKAKVKDFRDVKPAPRRQEGRSFDARDRHGLRADEEGGWRKKRSRGSRHVQEDTTIRPSELKIRLPMSVKDLAAEMKLKASQLIAKLFMQGMAVTLNDLLEDEVVIQLLGQEFGCEITVDKSEEQRIRITDKSIREEIAEQAPESLQLRAPVVTFMGHVDHGKTSLIDAIRKSNRVADEAGAITQHIGAFRCTTPVGDIAILDTPGHEAFSAMRARGADVTDIVVLVIAGDEGIRQQTVEAIQHAKAAGVVIVVAMNKSDKHNFNPENVYRQLADQNLLPEAWGGQTITVPCSATTGAGIDTLLEMLAVQAEVLELKANPSARARGSVLESEMHKGLGAVATVLVQNGTLHHGDSLVFGQHWGRVKTMRNEFSQTLEVAGPSTPVEITGLSGLPEAGQEFIVVKSEKEAREIAEARSQGVRQNRMQQVRKVSMENLFQHTKESSKKILNIILRADVQGSLEALKTVLQKIESEKVELNIIMAGVGEISESDVQMAEASHAAIIGFHTQVESHAEAIIKQYGIVVHLHDIIYHVVDQVKAIMTGLLDKVAEEQERGVTEVKTIFKSSQYGTIAGCQVSEGSIHRNHLVRIRRNKEIVWKGHISSLKRMKEDVREVLKGYECGVLLQNYSDVQVGDLIESYEVVYHTQEL